MSIPLEKKVPLLRSFDTKLYEKGWQFHDSMFIGSSFVRGTYKTDLDGENEKDRSLLENFDVVIDQFLLLKPA